MFLQAQEYASPSSRQFDGAKQTYFLLNQPQLDQQAFEQSRQFLEDSLQECRVLPIELPKDMVDLDSWIAQRTEATGSAYRNYLSARKQGAGRRFFENRSHALHFLRCVAPTKLVDGAWLYGALNHWHDTNFRDLIRTYLEELGDGCADKNHVVLYKDLLKKHGCDQWEELSETHFVQGAIQLCLAHHADHYLPELIGYNLGYEQLPLHLPITAYELNELGIDPYYFTLHITIDNVTTGHAHKALAALKQLMPVLGDSASFYRRVMDGYRLNDLGANTVSVIKGFDIETALIDILRAKASVGKNMHSDYCRVAGRTINEWLGEPDAIPGFLKALEQAGWFNRGEPAENSRFWKLLQGDHAEMFGVFNEYEQQVLRDWIGVPASTDDNPSAAARPANIATFRARYRTRNTGRSNPHGESPRISSISSVPAYQDTDLGDSSDEKLLEKKLSDAADKEAMMQMLIPLMSPANHHTSVGLMATRQFSRIFG